MPTGGLGTTGSLLGSIGLGYVPYIPPAPPGGGPVIPGGYPAVYEVRTSDLDGSDEVLDIPVFDLGYAELLSDSWTATFSCPDHQSKVTYDNLRPGRLVKILRNGDLRWAGVMWATDAQRGGGTGSLRFSAVGWFEALKYRYLLPADKLRYSTPASPFDIMWDAVQYSNAQYSTPGLTRGFEIGRSDTHAFKATWNWWDGSSIADIIQTAGRLPYVSLDWFVDQEKVWNVIRRSDGGRAPNSAMSLTMATNIEAISASEEITDTATQVLSVAAGEGKDMLYSLTDIDANDDLFGLMQIYDTQAQNRFGQRDQDFLDLHAANVLAAQDNTQARLSVDVKTDLIDWTQTFVGDILTVDYRDADSGFIQVNGPYRLAQRSVTITESGREKSTWLFDTPDRARS